MNLFAGERPYICDICQKGFKQSSDLKKHRRTHTLDKPYKCPLCPSAFTRSHHCRGHINSVHKFFKCGTCSALFTTEEDFNKHKELHPMLKVQKTANSNNIQTREVLGSKLHAALPSEYIKEAVQVQKQEDRETKLTKEPWHAQMISPQKPCAERTRDHVNNCLSRSRENIALAEFMASMAAQRSAGWSSTSNPVSREKLQLNNNGEHSKCLPEVSEAVRVPEPMKRGDLNHFTEKIPSDNTSPTSGSPFLMRRKFHDEKALLNDGRDGFRNHLRDSVYASQMYWVCNPEKAINCVTKGQNLLPRRDNDDAGKIHMRPVPLILCPISPKKEPRTSSLEAERSTENGADMITSLPRERSQPQCHRVSVIHYHSSSSSSDKSSPVKEINEGKQMDDSSKNDSSEESLESRNCSPNMAPSEDGEKSVGEDVKFVYHDASHPQMMSGYNEPFIPADDRTIGEHFHEVSRKRSFEFLNKDIPNGYEHQRNINDRTSWGGHDLRISQKRGYPFFNSGTSEGIMKGSQYLKSERYPMEKIIKVEKIKPEPELEPEKELVMNDSGNEQTGCDTPPFKKQLLSSKTPVKNEDEKQHDEEEQDSKSRFVNIAPKPEEKKAKGE